MFKQCLLCIVMACLAASPVQADAIQDKCKALVLDYAYYRDRPDADGVADLFTESATLSLSGKEFKGREKIRARILAGLDGPTYRHMMSTIRIFPVDNKNATGVSYVTVYRGPQNDGPIAVAGFAIVGEYHDEFVFTDSGWKIQQRKFVPIFSRTVGD